MSMKKQEMKVTGMHCSGCKDRVAKVLNNLKGIRSAEVSLDEERAEVTYDSEQAEVSQMIEAIEKAGYDAEQL